MDQEPEIIRIEIPVEEDPPLRAEEKRGPRLDYKAGANRAGQAFNKAAGKAWGSRARKSVTGGVKKGVAKGVTAVAAKSADLMHEHLLKAAETQAKQQAANLETKLRETDWQTEASKGAAAGLSWAGEQVEKLATRFSPEEERPEA